jgi:hypothetical protein
MKILYILSEALIKNPGLPVVNPKTKIPEIITYMSVLAAVISILVIVIAGVQFVISSGEPGKVTKARTAILYATIGLIVSLSATAIANFVVRNVT